MVDVAIDQNLNKIQISFILIVLVWAKFKFIPLERDTGNGIFCWSYNARRMNVNNRGFRPRNAVKAETYLQPSPSIRLESGSENTWNTIGMNARMQKTQS